MSRRMLKNQLARALDVLGDGAKTPRTTDSRMGGGGAKTPRTTTRTKTRARGVDARKMSKQAVRERQREMRRAGAGRETREMPSEEAREKARRRNAAYFAAATGKAEERDAHAAKLLGTEAASDGGESGGGGGGSDEEDAMW